MGPMLGYIALEMQLMSVYCRRSNRNSSGTPWNELDEISWPGYAGGVVEAVVNSSDHGIVFFQSVVSIYQFENKRSIIPVM